MSKSEPSIKYSVEGYNKLVKEFQQESDRSVIIVTISYIENYLEYCLKKRLVNHTIANNLFEGYAPLNTLSAKIDISFCLGLITDQIHAELHKLRKIRNLSAHEDSIVNFDIGQIKDLYNNLISAKGIRTSSKKHFKVNDTRAQFLLSIFWCMIHLETQRKRIEPISKLKLNFEIVDDES